MSRRTVRAIYATLLADHGSRRWWPGETRLEIIVGAILTQNTAWTNVEKAIASLKAERFLSLKGLREVDEARLAETIRASGYFRQKARKLKAFMRWLDGRHGGSLARAARVETGVLRADLLSIWGIGNETADSILLYAFGRPVFVVDAYTHRILRRHALHPGGGYEEVREMMERLLARDAALYNDYHAQLVWAGHHFCRTRPRCEVCPLRRHLPAAGAVLEGPVRGLRP
jgi:endonuclease-3 related protein